jgi:phosphopantetheinyl transferase (holo-ACP synthase)
MAPLFSVDVLHHVVDPVPGGFLAKLIERLDTLVETNAELAVGLAELKDLNERDRAEVLAKLAALQEAVDKAQNVDPGVLAAFLDLKTSMQARDADVEPEAPPVE